ncbi:phosphate acyltransferase PlsX [Alkalicoccus urumqiensis]|uniref:Phosphate acyltransferase n=1 Tax=Alkalicoccus urumqiensis TaxID=1548213 RepID=A0A2P6MG59_ALKUR|nr:phosphate acyltransferase PlsX [Alkalicoccus urumqiensis]PRO65264.1 phosphate acyltransferase PlsX [Alkalicoccus urumqiensis]
MKLAVDVMGGDNAPQSALDGCRSAHDAFPDLELILVGDESQMKEDWLESSRVRIVHTTEKIESDDAPVKAVRRKKEASMVKAVQMVKDKEADACISAGNTGALMTAGLLIVGRIPGIERPALAPMLPTLDGGGFLLLDVGANMEAKASHLVQYAEMGSVYMNRVRGIEKPRVALLNVGAEGGKGTELVKEAFDGLEQADIHFIGNIEGRELLEGRADIVVTDGFSGNLVLKTIEGTALSLFQILRKELTSSLKNKLAAGVLKPAFKNVRSKLDYAEYGGAGLFGLQAPVIKAHGSSDGHAFFSAVRQAVTMHQENVIPMIRKAAEEE